MPTTTAATTITIDGRPVELKGDERNLLEVIRASGVDLPTFCYHSELSVYGSCRLCLVDIAGKGIQASCSLKPEAGMAVRTQTGEVRRLRKTTLELLLANHHGNCATCDRASNCRLQDLARRLGVDDVRFRKLGEAPAVDRSSPAVTRDPGKCVLCGDCVRMCTEVQGVGALDFAHRGARTVVQPAFGAGMGESECVHCGQCARVCPTGALTPASEVEEAWRALTAPGTTVVVQVAPAVRVALGEEFGLPPGAPVWGHLVAALRRLGAAAVYDTAFTADLTIWEEAHEFLGRLKAGTPLPLFTSCCPAWVKYVEQFHPSKLHLLSTCKSPQQMFGALARRFLPKRLKTRPEDLVVVSVMPCTAKKFEARRPEFAPDGRRDIDVVLTTRELATLIRGAGIDLARVTPESPDLPFGLKSGAGVLFGNSGGVSEAVLRYADAVIGDGKLRMHEFRQVRGQQGVREAEVATGGRTLRVAVVSGLANAGRVLADIEAGRVRYDLVEVMACPGGCVNGAGQPCSHDGAARQARTEGIYAADRAEVLRNPADNMAVRCLYADELGGEPGAETAHDLLHTEYAPRKRVNDLDLLLTTGEPKSGRLMMTVCLGTSCHLRGAQQLLQGLLAHVEAKGLQDRVDVRATFCLERCADGPNVRLGDKVLHRATLETAVEAMHLALKG